jgi:hypothetical protein
MNIWKVGWFFMPPIVCFDRMNGIEGILSGQAGRSSKPKPGRLGGRM